MEKDQRFNGWVLFKCITEDPREKARSERTDVKFVAVSPMFFLKKHTGPTLPVVAENQSIARAGLITHDREDWPLYIPANPEWNPEVAINMIRNLQRD